MASSIRLHRLGRHHGEHDIEVSCGAMDVMDGTTVTHRIVIDCGLAPRNTDGVKSWTGPDFSLFNDGKKIDAAFITHIHGDHVGMLPALVPYLSPEARVGMTKTSWLMLKSVLEDGVAIHERANTAGPFGRRQMEEIMERVRTFHNPGEYDILPGVKAFVWPAGHINGACSFTFDVNGYKVHYAGDRCEHDQPGILGAEPLPAKWRPQAIAVSDCTYGADPDSDNRVWNGEMTRGVEIAHAAMRKGAPVLFCTFGVHRGGAVAESLYQQGVDLVADLVLDGACRKFTKIVQDRASAWCDRDRPLNIGGVTMVPDGKGGSRFREKVLRDQRNFVVIAPPGMGGPGGIVSYWRREILPNPDAAIVFTGYVAPGTDGEKILTAARCRQQNGLETVCETFNVEGPDGRIEQEDLPIRCNVAQIRLSGHNSRRQTINWFGDHRPEVAVLTHGSKAALASIESELGGLGRLSRADREHCVEIAL